MNLFNWLHKTPPSTETAESNTSAHDDEFARARAHLRQPAPATAHTSAISNTADDSLQMQGNVPDQNQVVAADERGVDGNALEGRAAGDIDTLEERSVVDIDTLEERVVDALRTVFDPEIPVNIYDLGLIYGIAIDPVTRKVHVDMTLTAPGCPVAQTFPDTVRERVEMVDGVSEATVELVWEPPWTRDRMSEAAQLELGML